MQVSKLDDGLVVRIPQSVADAMGLKEGDEVEVRPAETKVESRPEISREEALEMLRKIRKPFPPDFKFDREEAHER